MTPVIPRVDAIPLPAPTWLLTFFLIFTFLLHLVPMSVTLGGGFWAIVAVRRSEVPAYRDLAARLGRWLPYWAAATVTTGVAALLFLQVLYGPVFYAASVLLAWPWLSVVALLLIGYYGYYFRSYRFAKNPRAASWVGFVAWLAFAAIAFIFVNQMTLMLHPERHYAMYLESARGLHFHLVEPSLAPRYLHMLVAALALAALWVGLLGLLALRRGEGESGRRVLTLGCFGFALCTALQIPIGTWMLLAQPHRVVEAFVGGSVTATLYLSVSVLLALSVILVAAKAPRAARPSRALGLAAGHLGPVVLLMVLVRDAVRRTTLGDVLDLSAMAAKPQWGVIILFLLLLIAGLATLAYMLLALRRLKSAPGAPTDARS